MPKYNMNIGNVGRKSKGRNRTRCNRNNKSFNGDYVVVSQKLKDARVKAYGPGFELGLSH